MYDFSHKLLLWILCVKSHNDILVGHVTNRWWGGYKMGDVSFHHFYFIYMTSMIDDKMMWVQLSLQFDMNIDNPTLNPPPTYVPTYLPTYPPTHLSTYLLAYPLNHLPTTYLSPTYLPTYFINLRNYLPTFYFLFPITYLSSYHLLPTS
jgi:hypothetical protein